MTESKSVALPLGDAPTWRRDRLPSRPRKARTAIGCEFLRPKPTTRCGRSFGKPVGRPPACGRCRSRWRQNRSCGPEGSPVTARSLPAHRQFVAPETERVLQGRFVSAGDQIPGLWASCHPLLGNRAGSENPPVRARNTKGVATATPGLISKRPMAGSGGRGREYLPDTGHQGGQAGQAHRHIRTEPLRQQLKIDRGGGDFPEAAQQPQCRRRVCRPAGRFQRPPGGFFPAPTCRRSSVPRGWQALGRRAAPDYRPRFQVRRRMVRLLTTTTCRRVTRSGGRRSRRRQQGLSNR